MYGSGSYSLNAVKEIRGTDEFKKLPEIEKQCQTKQSFEECTSNQLLEKMILNCKCIPFELKNLTDNDKEKVRIEISHLKVGI